MILAHVKVGDKLTVRKGGGDTQLRTVARVTKTTVIDSAGATWNINGWKRGAGALDASYAKPWEPKDDDAIAKHAEKVRIQHMQEGLRSVLLGPGAPKSLIEKCHSIVLQNGEEEKR